jgi:hypothetical protein
MENLKSVFTVHDYKVGIGLKNKGLLGIFDSYEKAFEYVGGDDYYLIKEVKLNETLNSTPTKEIPLKKYSQQEIIKILTHEIR